MAAAGSYRQLHARLRTNAESVAFYGGIEKEGNLIVSKFKELVRHQVKLLNTQWRFAMWQVCTYLLAPRRPTSSILNPEQCIYNSMLSDQCLPAAWACV